MTSMAAPLFRGRRFYLTRTIAPPQRQRIHKLIKERGGEVTTDLRGAIQLVGQEHLDPRQDWVSADFVLDSVARGALQDLSAYMGAELAPAPQLPPRGEGEEAGARPREALNGHRRHTRIKYSDEDDARMLLFLQSNFAQKNTSMASIPLSVWENASRKKVTNHSAQSMHERYRKQLRAKTPAERREIISRALKRAGVREEEEEEKEGEVEEIESETEDEGGARAPPSTAVAELPAAAATAPVTLPPTPSTAQEQQEQTPMATRPNDNPLAKHSSSESPSSDGEGDKRPRKRLRRATSAPKEPARSSEPPAAASPPVTPPVPSPRRRQSSPRAPLSQTTGVATRSSSKSATKSLAPAPPSPSSSENDEGGEEGGRVDGQRDQEASPTRTRVDAGVSAERGFFFSSIWAAAFADPSRRQRLHGLFESVGVPSTTTAAPREDDSPAEASPPSASRGVSTPAASLSVAGPPSPPTARTPERQQQSPASDATATPRPSQKVSDAAGIAQPTPPEAERRAEADPTASALELPLPLEVEYSTERELESELCRIEFETKAHAQAILHALYYSSGSYATATAFLKGESPAGMWSPQDDLLLASLTSAATTTEDVEAAARAGAFAAMRVQRSADDILARVRYLL